MTDTPFTKVFLSIRLAAFAAPALSATARLLSVFVFVAFHTSIAMDTSIIDRMCVKNGWSRSFFHAGNVVVHVLPFVDALASNECEIQSIDVVLSVAIFAWWTAFQTQWLCYDHIYVHMVPLVWYVSHVTGLAGVLALWCVR